MRPPFQQCRIKSGNADPIATPPPRQTPKDGSKLFRKGKSDFLLDVDLDVLGFLLLAVPGSIGARDLVFRELFGWVVVFHLIPLLDV
jgi:hypothetical protein